MFYLCLLLLSCKLELFFKCISLFTSVCKALHPLRVSKSLLHLEGLEDWEMCSWCVKKTRTPGWWRLTSAVPECICWGNNKNYVPQLSRDFCHLSVFLNLHSLALWFIPFSKLVVYFFRKAIKDLEFEKKRRHSWFEMLYGTGFQTKASSGNVAYPLPLLWRQSVLQYSEDAEVAFSGEDWVPLWGPALDKGTLFSSRSRTSMRRVRQARPSEPQGWSAP